MIKDVVEYLVKRLVESPETVAVVLDETEQRVTITVVVASSDLKRVIGREGRVVRAIQSLIAAYEPTRGVDVVVNAAQ